MLGEEENFCNLLNQMKQQQEIFAEQNDVSESTALQVSGEIYALELILNNYQAEPPVEQ